MVDIDDVVKKANKKYAQTPGATKEKYFKYDAVIIITSLLEAMMEEKLTPQIERIVKDEIKNQRKRHQEPD